MEFIILGAIAIGIIFTYFYVKIPRSLPFETVEIIDDAPSTQELQPEVEVDTSQLNEVVVESPRKPKMKVIE